MAVAAQPANIIGDGRSFHLGHDPLLSFEPFTLPASNQRVLTAPHPEGTTIPLALRPVTKDSIDQAGAASGVTSPVTLDKAVETIKYHASRGEIDALLSKHGVLLFRGLPIHDAEDFSRFAHAFGYDPHEIIGIVVDRPLLAPNVAPANEAPPSVNIGSHNESPQVPHAPAYVFFYGHRAPAKGGETPIGSSLELFRRAQEEIPEFIEELAKKGTLHTISYKPEAQYLGGSTLKQAFGKEIKEDDDEETRKKKIEAQIGRYNRDSNLTSWEWSPDGSIILHHVLPTIRTQPGTGYPALFTSLAAQYAQKLRHSETDRAKAYPIAKYGDGSEIPEEYLKALFRITEETRVLHKWERGDVLVFDNRVAQHGREPWEGESEDRRIFASLWDGELPGPYGNQPFEFLRPALSDEGVAVA